MARKLQHCSKKWERRRRRKMQRRRQRPLPQTCGECSSYDYCDTTFSFESPHNNLVHALDQAIPATPGDHLDVSSAQLEWVMPNRPLVARGSR